MLVLVLVLVLCCAVLAFITEHEQRVPTYSTPYAQPCSTHGVGYIPPGTPALDTATFWRRPAAGRSATQVNMACKRSPGGRLGHSHDIDCSGYAVLKSRTVRAISRADARVESEAASPAAKVTGAWGRVSSPLL